jgi:hypothetical protein
MSDSTNTRIIESLYEELVRLDEIAGQLDEVSNRKVNDRRIQIKKELIDLGEKL